MASQGSGKDINMISNKESSQGEGKKYEYDNNATVR